MSCKDTQPLIHGYADGELDPVRNMEIEAHLGECPVCAQAYKNQQALRSAIKTAPLYFRSPAGLEKRIRSAVRKESKAESILHPMLWRWLSVAASLALVTIIAWSFATLLSRPSAEDRLAQEVLASHVRSLMASHLTDVPSSDQHTVKPWFAGKLDFSPPVEDLSRQGFALVGGRLDYVENEPVAALVYQRRQHFINLFVWTSRHDSERQKALTHRGYNLLHWTQAGMNYWAVSDLNRNELQGFAQLIQNR